jgi:pimeloyl-ACP methyl ester carboxylesterase
VIDHRTSAITAAALFFVLTALSGCVPATAPSASYRFEAKVFDLGEGRDLRCTIAFPPGPAGLSASPLILALHPGGNAGGIPPFYGKFILSDLLIPGLGDLAAILVAPDCPGKSWADPVSVEAVVRLLDRIGAEYHVDKSRCLVAGYSMGAVGAWVLAARFPGRFSAAVAIAGVPDKPLVFPDMKAPVFSVQSRIDEIFAFEEARRFVRNARSQGVEVRFETVAGFGHYDVTRYIPSLRPAVPWIKEIWQAKGRPRNAGDDVDLIS